MLQETQVAQAASASGARRVRLSVILGALSAFAPLSIDMYLFGTNALGIVIAGQVSGRLVGRVSPRRLMTLGLVACASGGLTLLAVVVAGLGLAGILPALFVVVASLGLILPNATTLALTGHPRTAGSTSALLGVMQFAIGAAAAPLVGIGGATSDLPMAVVIATLSCSALAVFMLLARPAAR